jgi:hypothetical protein
MICIWISRLVPHALIPNRWGPKLEQVLNPLGRGFRWAFTTTDANRTKPIAFGIAELDAAQFAAADADLEVWVVDLTGWRTKQVNDFPASVRKKINDLLAERNISAGIQITDTLPIAFGKIVTALGGNLNSLDSILTSWRNHGGGEV